MESPRVPRLEVAINGHRALYFQHPVLDYSGGDVNNVFEPNYSADTITAELPTNFLRQGTNELVLTANDDPTERDDSTNSGLYYDALELDQDAGAKFSTIRTHGSGSAHDLLYAERRRVGGVGGRLCSSQFSIPARAGRLDDGQCEIHRQAPSWLGLRRADGGVCRGGISRRLKGRSGHQPGRPLATLPRDARSRQEVEFLPRPAHSPRCGLHRLPSQGGGGAKPHPGRSDAD